MTVSCNPAVVVPGTQNRVWRGIAVASAAAGQDGSATVRIQSAADAAGNAMTPYSEPLFTIDATPPMVDAAFNLALSLGAIPPAVNGTIASSTSILSASVSDNLAGVAAVTIDLSSPFLNVGSVVTPMMNVPGTYRYSAQTNSTSGNAEYFLIVSATDGAQNSATDALRIIVDNEAPVWASVYQVGDATNGTDSSVASNQIDLTANITGIGLDNRPDPGVPSGIRRVRAFYRSFDGTGGEPVLTYSGGDTGMPSVDGTLVDDYASAPAQWRLIGEQVFPYGTSDPVNFDILWNAGSLPATNVRTFENYYLVDVVFEDVAGNMLGPVLAVPATGAWGQYSLLQIQDKPLGGITWLQAHSERQPDVQLDWRINGPAGRNVDLARTISIEVDKPFTSVIQPGVFHHCVFPLASDGPISRAISKPRPRRRRESSTMASWRSTRRKAATLTGLFSMRRVIRLACGVFAPTSVRSAFVERGGRCALTTCHAILDYRSEGVQVRASTLSGRILG